MAFTNYLEDENDKPYFTTNSLAYYYDKMEGFAKAVEGSAKALNLTKEEVEKRITFYIEQNKNELDQRLADWDGKIETFDGSVEKLLTEWVDDGTLTHVIDSTLIDQKIAPVTAQWVETEDKLAITSGKLSGLVVKSKVKPNLFGERSINILGASNVHGAGTEDMANNAYASIIRKYFQRSLNMKNHGFVNSLGHLGTGDIYKDFHDITGDWAKTNSNSAIGNAQRFTNTLGAKMYVTIKTPVKGFRVYYGGTAKNTQVAVRVGGVLKTTINTMDVNPYKRTELINVSDQTFPLTIEFEKLDVLTTVGIHGIGYYDNDKDIVVNNFARSGVTLSAMDNALLDVYVDSDLIVFGLGNNDSGGALPMDVFQAKLDYLKEKILTRGTYLIVTDYIWHPLEGHAYKEALKKFALDCGGVYLNLYKEVFNSEGHVVMQQKGYLVDSSHLSTLGHKMVGEYIIEQMEPDLSSLNFSTATASTNPGSSSGKTDATWTNVGSVEVPFQNQWVNSVTNATRFRKINGVVHLEIYMTSPTNAGTAFDLPIGYRPKVPIEQVYSYGVDVMYAVRITTSGRVDIRGIPVNGVVTYTTNYGAIISFIDRLEV